MAQSAIVFLTYVAAAILVGALVAVALTLDWSRDLTTNVAETEVNSSDPALRPLAANESVAEAVAALRLTVAESPRWTWVDEDRDSHGAVIRLVRTTRFLRFKDDVTVWVAAADGGSLISARSESRVGSGDLGQNPRNLRELLGALRPRLDRSEAR